MDKDAVKKLFENEDHFGSQYTGVKFEDAAEGYAKCSLTVEGHHLNRHRILHGGAMFTLIDMAAGTAAAMGRDNFVTLTANITYSAPSYPGEKIYAEARAVGESRRLSNFVVTVTNESGKVLATATAIMYSREPK